MLENVGKSTKNGVDVPAIISVM